MFTCKKEENFDTLAYFIKYLYGNVLIQIYNTNEQIAVPIYCTKFIAKNIRGGEANFSEITNTNILKFKK
jgi:hypothetical protein